MKKSEIRIGIGMSGGIDSCVAAYLLKEQGYDVTGFTIKMWDEGSRCCDIEEITRAQQFSHKIGIPHYVLDLRKEFKKHVVDYFIDDYLKGLTPNPCVICNREIKFDYLFEKKEMLNFDFIATGHYVKMKAKGARRFLAQAKDEKKSQEYFLARVKKEYLSRMLFPLSNMTKEKVKKIASTIDFIFRKGESQEVCFVKPGIKYPEFILDYMKKNHRVPDDLSAKIVNKKGEILGESDCYFKYTIGQRGGLGISDSTPYYVLRIDPENRHIVVGKKEDIYQTDFTVRDVYWYVEKPIKKGIVKIRYNHKGDKADIYTEGDNVKIRFKSPQLAITPGQLAVFYKGSIVAGSGWIDTVD